MANGLNESDKPLKMVTCGHCKAKTFIPGGLAPFATVPCTKCAHPVMLPVMMRNFELRTVIASGGMGTVFTAFDVKLQREVALKMMKREIAEDKEIMEAFYREARAGASLNHTNIIHIYSFDEFEGQPYLVMELAGQGSLDQRIETETCVPELDVLDVGIKVSSALATALKHNLLHRDIKPGNILYNSEGEPKLVDFGLARAAESDQVAESFVYGTPQYVAPEKVNRGKETFLADMYSLGATMYHALVGQVPFRSESVDPEEAIQQMTFSHVHTALTPPNQVATHITQLTSDALCRAMEKNPAHRFPTYEDFRMALEEARSCLLVQQVRAAEQADQPASGKSWWRR